MGFATAYCSEFNSITLLWEVKSALSVKISMGYEWGLYCLLLQEIK